MTVLAFQNIFVTTASTVIKYVHPCRIYSRFYCDSHKKHETLPGHTLQETNVDANVVWDETNILFS